MHPSHPVVGLGRRPALADELTALDAGAVPSPIPARVLAAHTDRWLVAPVDPDAPPGPAGLVPDGEPLLVPARGRLRDAACGPGTPTTGDWVVLDAEAGARPIAAVIPRGPSLVRRAAGRATAPQTLAANVDLVLVVEPLVEGGVRRVERFAALARAGGIDVVLVGTKADLVDDPDADARTLARRAGIPDAVAVSATTEGGLDPLLAFLRPGATVAVLGRSGAGKSTLVGALAGTDRLATGPVRALDGRGRHTTVTRELVAIPAGALLLDTPGLREIGTWDGTGDGFADLEALAATCRFPDCRHDGEPGCAVAGAVDPGRLDAWRRLQREQAWVDDRRAASRDREARGRRHVKEQRAARRRKGNEGR